MHIAVKLLQKLQNCKNDWSWCAAAFLPCIITIAYIPNPQTGYFYYRQIIFKFFFYSTTIWWPRMIPKPILIIILHYLNLTSSDKFSQKILWLSFLLDLEVLVKRAKNYYPNCKIQSRYYSFYLLSPFELLIGKQRKWKKIR